MVDKPIEFNTALAQELNEVAASRELRQEGGSERDDDPFKRANKMRLFGLALSGGGIRSATFNLGVLQALDDLGILKKVDYLSTVSGGGYIGSWLISWIKRTQRMQGNAQYPSLSGESSSSTSQNDRKEPDEIRFLRRYSNYLTPKLGAFNADTWTVVSTYVRNLVLNMTIVVLALAAILLLPRIALHATKFLNYYREETYLYFSLAMFLIVTVWIGANLARLARTEKSKKTTGQGFITFCFVLIVFLGAISLACWFKLSPVLSDLGWLENSIRKYIPENVLGQQNLRWILWTSGTYALLWLLGWVLYSIGAGGSPPGSSGNKIQLTLSWATILIAGLFAGILGGFMFSVLSNAFMNPEPLSLVCGTFIAWTPVAVITILTVVVVFQIGLVGIRFSDEMREWWSRFGAWLAIYSLGWEFLWGIAIFAPLLVLKSVSLVDSYSSELLGGLSVTWVLTTITGILAGKSERTGKPGSNRLLEFVVQAAPFVFVAGLLVVLSYGIHLLSFGIQEHFTTLTFSPDLLLTQYCDKLQDTVLSNLLWCLAFCILVSIVLSLRVDINEFSMHAMYRNRLVRCYLGASNKTRTPHPFTGFDKFDDEYDLTQFSNGRKRSPDGHAPPKRGHDVPYVGPYPIVNTAINLVQGKELAWQTRKASSFAFTPHYCGYGQSYVPTPDSLSLGTAMAISGAAASPNMGYHTSAPLAFLMTLFNVRLGWWFPNPAKGPKEKNSGPPFGLFYLFFELFGATNDERKYVYLSDGGHFENLGLYELVRRRCRFIIVSDAGADPNLAFDDLGNAVEKCRTDFGVNIDIDVERIRRDVESGLSGWHCVVGRIQYHKVFADSSEGILIYIKSSLTGDEQADVLRYASRHPGFPHESTADQFFDESQFESYRALGYHICREVFSAVGSKREIAETKNEKLFVDLREGWFPPSTAGEGSFTTNTQKVSRIMEIVRTDKNLRFLDSQIYPEWATLEGNAKKRKVQMWLPGSAEEIRSGFYVCNEMIQVMEDTFIEINLGEEYDHPDNRGWMNLFKHWSWSGMFRVTWTISAATFGARFQTFCKKHLDLDIGDVEIRELTRIPADPKERRKMWAEQEKANVLNFMEMKLLELWTEQYREQITPDDSLFTFALRVSDPIDERSGLTFPFGFAIVSGKKSPGGRTLRYFRVQDHLRKMGLARKALVKLMQDERSHVRALDTTTLPGGLEAITENDVRRFRRLFDSALIETTGTTGQISVKKADGRRPSLKL